MKKITYSFALVLSVAFLAAVPLRYLQMEAGGIMLTLGALTFSLAYGGLAARLSLNAIKEEVPVNWQLLLLPALCFILVPIVTMDQSRSEYRSMSMAGLQNQRKVSELSSVSDSLRAKITARIAGDSTKTSLQEGLNASRKATEEALSVIEKTKKEFLELSGGLDEKGFAVQARKRNYSNDYFIDKGVGVSLLKGLDTYKAALEKLSPPATGIKLALLDGQSVMPDANAEKSFEERHFKNASVSGAVAVLGQFQAEIYAMEQVYLTGLLKAAYQK